MTERRLMPVHPDVVKEVLVDRILEGVLAREPVNVPAPVGRALEANLELPIADGGTLDLRMRGIGYLSRCVECEMFDPARHPLDGLGEMLRHGMAAGQDWPSAVSAVSCRYAEAEPLAKPPAGDDRAVSWKVPGPGGHVRHYVVAAAIAEVLSDPAHVADRMLPAGITDAGELKRCWTYGFMVRCCEEVVPPVQAPESG
jgi:hypothetical protein